MFEILKKTRHLLAGKQAEQTAQDYLISQGLKPVCRNYRSRYGELDLVMQDGASLAIIEVRYRKSDAFGSALESVTTTKQAKIIATTQHYMGKLKLDCPLRFDVVAISGDGSINWIKNAF